jgi:hypothetical protein
MWFGATMWFGIAARSALLLGSSWAAIGVRSAIAAWHALLLGSAVWFGSAIATWHALLLGSPIGVWPALLLGSAVWFGSAVGVRSTLWVGSAIILGPALLFGPAISVRSVLMLRSAEAIRPALHIRPAVQFETRTAQLAWGRTAALRIGLVLRLLVLALAPTEAALVPAPGFGSLGLGSALGTSAPGGRFIDEVVVWQVLNGRLVAAGDVTFRKPRRQHGEAVVITAHTSPFGSARPVPGLWSVYATSLTHHGWGVRRMAGF